MMTALGGLAWAMATFESSQRGRFRQRG